MLEFVTLVIVAFCLWKAKRIIRLNRYLDKIKQQITEFVFEVEMYEPIIISSIEEDNVELEKQWEKEWPITIKLRNGEVIAENPKQLLEYLRTKGELILDEEEVYRKNYGIYIDSQSSGYQIFLEKMRNLRVIQLSQKDEEPLEIEIDFF